MPIERSNVPGLAQPPGYTYLAMVREARLVFIAGQVPLDERGELVGRGDAIAQARQCLGNLAACLAATCWWRPSRKASRSASAAHQTASPSRVSWIA
jgi:enamine deaminase RidA (YjgF/YER057c/UK114 family)